MQNSKSVRGQELTQLHFSTQKRRGMSKIIRQRNQMPTLAGGQKRMPASPLRRGVSCDTRAVPRCERHAHVAASLVSSHRNVDRTLGE